MIYSHKTGTGPALYGGTWPAWRTAPTYQSTPFGSWLEAHCEARHLTRTDLAHLLAERLPYTRHWRSVYNAVTAWVYSNAVPATDYAQALAEVFDVPLPDILVILQPSRNQRATMRLMPVPPRPRRMPTYETPETLLAQADADVIAHLRSLPEYQSLLRAHVARLEAEARGQSAQRVVPGAPAEPMPTQTREQEEVTR